MRCLLVFLVLIIMVPAVRGGEVLPSDLKRGEEITREWDKGKETRIILTEEEIARRKSQAERAALLIRQRVMTVYSHNLSEGSLLSEWSAIAKKFSSRLRDHISVNLQAGRSFALRRLELHKNLLENEERLTQNHAYSDPASAHPAYLSVYRRVIEELKSLAFQAAMERWQWEMELYPR